MGAKENEANLIYSKPLRSAGVLQLSHWSMHSWHVDPIQTGAQP
jgi:hypothetical protein